MDGSVGFVASQRSHDELIIWFPMRVASGSCVLGAWLQVVTFIALLFVSDEWCIHVCARACVEELRVLSSRVWECVTLCAQHK